MSADGNIYFYDASLAASALFTVLNALPTAFLVYTTIIGPRTGKYRDASFFIPLCIGGLMEVGGYIIRCISIQNNRNIPIYATSSSLIVIAPVLVCASLYLLLGKLVRAGIPTAPGQKQARILGITAHWLPRVFIASDILSFSTQAGGSGIASSNNWQPGPTKDLGENVLIAGLALQLATFSAFMALIIRFHQRARLAAKHEISSGLKKVLIGLYISGFFIEVRCIYRLIEFIMGTDGYPFRHEWPLYVLEACPMLFALCALGYFHPGKWLPVDSTPDHDEELNRLASRA
ncbi:hypothetical protein FQN57_006798 [Myotisia sp. PD_48]|nr:hypothetical protein FQN57_006798 [Myotisia sp. PD_48]